MLFCKPNLHLYPTVYYIKILPSTFSFANIRIIRLEAYATTNAIKSSQAISRANMEQQFNVSETIFFSIIKE
jgi:hypothetical protein